MLEKRVALTVRIPASVCSKMRCLIPYGLMTGTFTLLCQDLVGALEESENKRDIILRNITYRELRLRHFSKVETRDSEEPPEDITFLKEHQE